MDQRKPPERDAVPEPLQASHLPLQASPEMVQMMQSARQAADYLKVLAHENRLLLLCLLAERERSVTELEGLLALRQPTVSQQLARLRSDGLVRTRREGKVIHYSLADERTRAFIQLIHSTFCAH